MVCVLKSTLTAGCAAGWAGEFAIIHGLVFARCATHLQRLSLFFTSKEGLRCPKEFDRCQFTV